MDFEDRNWQQTAFDFQQEICENFGDVNWDVYQQNEVHILKDKVKVLLYGPSTVDQSAEAEALVDRICKVIVKEGTCEHESTGYRKAIYMMFIFVIGTSDNQHISYWPVFKVPKNGLGFDACFIDLSCRVYKDWEDFLENNKLPAKEYCYPTNGNYYLMGNSVALKFGKAPQAKLTKKVLNGLDIASSGVAIGSTLVAVASLCVPVAGPVLAASVYAAGTVSAYSAIRSSNTLHDRRVHKQSIGLGDKEARGCYLTIAGSVVGIGASAATSAAIKTAQSGQVVGKFATSAVTALNGGSLLINGVGMIHGVHHLYVKHQEGQLSALDVTQFTASLLLFCHATVNFQTARTIIEKSQNYVIQDYDKSLGSRWKRLMLRTAVKCSTKLYGSSAGKSLVIRSIRRINSADDYFSVLCPENEILSTKASFNVLLSNIGLRFGFQYVDVLLSVFEKFELIEILRRFTEPFQKMIMKLCDFIFNSMTQTSGFDFLYIARFISEFVHHIITLIFMGEREFVLSLLVRRIPSIPSEQMNPLQFCFAVMEEILLNPSSILVMYKHLQSFFVILLDKSRIVARDDCKVDFIQLFSACSILLKMDKPHWEIIMDFAKGIFDSLNLRKFSSLVVIVKKVCLYIQQKVLDMRRRYDQFRNGNSIAGEGSRHDFQIQESYATAIGSLFDHPECQSFADGIREQNLDAVSEEEITENRERPEYTEKNPLILRKCFLIREQQDFLTGEEILDICKKTLKCDNLPSDCSVMQDNSQFFVRCGNLLVVITCDLENEATRSYSRPLPLDTLESTSQFME